MVDDVRPAVSRAGRPRGLDLGRVVVPPGWLPIAVAGFLLVGTRQAFTVPYTGLGLSPAQLLLLLLGVLWLLTRVAGQRYPVGLGVLSGLIVVRWCFVLISYGLGSGRVLAPSQHLASDQAVLVEGVVALVVIVMATLVRTRRDLEFVIRSLVAGGALSGSMAVVQFATGIDVAAFLHLPGLRETIAPQGTDLVRAGVVRVAGAAAQPLELAAVTTVLIPLAAAGFFAARGRGGRSWPWALATGLMLAGSIVSLSRSTFIALGVALLVMALRWPVARTAAVLGTAVGLGAVALVAGGGAVQAVTTLLTQGSDDYSLGSRAAGRAYVLAHVTDHFWWGQGPGTYDSVTQPVLDNQYLSQLIETGALGLLLSIGVLGCALWYALLATASRVEPGLRELAIGIAGSLAAVIMIELVLDVAGFVQVSTLIALDFGLAAAVWRIAVGPGSGGTPAPAGPSASVDAVAPDGLTPGAVAAR